VGSGGVIVIRLHIEIWVIGKGGTKRVGGEEVWGLLGFVVLVHFWLYFCCSIGGASVRDFRWLGLYTVGTVG
jgi:hypothetical protein